MALTKKQQRVKRDNEPYAPARMWKHTKKRNLKLAAAATVRRGGETVSMPQLLEEQSKLYEKTYGS